MEIRFSDADGFDAQAHGADLAVLVFTRAEVEAGLVGSAVERLMLFSDDGRHVRRFAGRVLLLFAGYDDDPRPLVQIPDCTRFFRAIDAQWSYWLHFLMPDPEVLRLALLMRVDVRVRSCDGKDANYELCHPAQLAGTLHRWFTAMNALHEAHGIDEAFNRAQSRAVMAALDGWS